MSLDLAPADLALRSIPYDPRAEQALIGWCLNHGTIPDELRVPSELFWTPARAVWDAMVGLVFPTRRAERSRCDPITVHGVMSQHSARAVHVGPDRLDLWLQEAMTLAGLDADQYVKTLTELHTRRRLIEIGARIMSVAQTSDMGADTQVECAERALSMIGDNGDHQTADELLTLDEFLTDEYPAPDWVLPGLLARGERFMLTGTPGLGKSTMGRQLGICGAAGVEPFCGVDQPPVTVLVVDLENPQYIAQKRWHELRKALSAHQRVVEPGRLWLNFRPDGLRLGNASDRRWLKRLVTTTNPDLVILGPAYKMMQGVAAGDRDELIARSVTEVIDELRATNGCAVVLETHAGKGTDQGGQRAIRPYGSALWEWWTEFGYGIREVDERRTPNARSRRLVDFIPWKLPRDPRRWPERLESSGNWMPWVEAVD